MKKLLISIIFFIILFSTNQTYSAEAGKSSSGPLAGENKPFIINGRMKFDDEKKQWYINGFGRLKLRYYPINIYSYHELMTENKFVYVEARYSKENSNNSHGYFDIELINYEQRAEDSLSADKDKAASAADSAAGGSGGGAGCAGAAAADDSDSCVVSGVIKFSDISRRFFLKSKDNDGDDYSYPIDNWSENIGLGEGDYAKLQVKITSKNDGHQYKWIHIITVLEKRFSVKEAAASAADSAGTGGGAGCATSAAVADDKSFVRFMVEADRTVVQVPERDFGEDDNGSEDSHHLVAPNSSLASSGNLPDKPDSKTEQE